MSPLREDEPAGGIASRTCAPRAGELAHALCVAQARLEGILRNAISGIITIDRHGTIEAFNPAAERMFLYPAEEVIGRDVSVLMPPPDRENHGTYMRAFLETGDAKVIGRGREVVGRRKDGTLFPMQLAITQVNLDGNPTFTGVIHDLTERRLWERKLQQARAELEQRVAQRTDELQASNLRLKREVLERRRIEKHQERLLAEVRHANQELQDFAHIVSHDLKAPLRAINTLAHWLRKDHREALNETGREHLALLSQRVVRLNNLIDGILSYSCAARVSPQLTPVDTGQVARDVVEALQPPDTFTFDIPDDLPVVVFDRTLLEQILQNLISNAVVHHGKPRGRIAVSARETNSHWEIAVRDDGAGIEERHFDRIFKVFQSLRPRDEMESTGIGLAIVKKIVERYGGRVTVASRVGEGSEFTVVLPRAPAPDVTLTPGS